MEHPLSINNALDQAVDGIALINPSGDWLAVNQKFCDLMGRARADLTRFRFQDLFKPSDQTTQANGSSFSAHTYQFQGRCVECNLAPFYHPNGALLGYSVIILSRTPEQRADRIVASADEHFHELTFLYDTSLETHARNNLVNLLQSITERATQLLGPPSAGLFLMEAEGTGLKLVVSKNFDCGAANLHLRLGEGISGRVAQAGEMLSVMNYSTWPGRVEALEDNDFKRVLSIPMKSNGHVIGVITMGDRGISTPFSDEQLHLASLFADQAAIAVENIYLYEAIQHQLVERQHVEENLRLAAKVIETTAEGVFITDADSRLISVNTAFSLITGYQPKEVIGKDVFLFQADQNDQDYFSQTWSLVATTGQWQGEIWNRRKDGEVYPEWITISTIRDATNRLTHYVGIFSDITLRKQTEKRLRHLATHDGLTDLPNRDLFRDRLDHAIMRTHRNSTGKSLKWQGAVMLLDLDHFKIINDTYGHAKGDQILQAVSEELKQCIRVTDTVARMGGDEFTLIIEEIATVQDAQVVAEKILASICKPIFVDGTQFNITCSIGISLFPQQGEDREVLVKQADIAMYRAKEKHNCFCVFPDYFGEAVS
jgi:diguanylate cyclase (GGDEF)-like protein/PAS domain S-box-containing protein